MLTDLKLELYFLYVLHVSAQGLVKHLVMVVTSNIHCMFQSFILTLPQYELTPEIFKSKTCRTFMNKLNYNKV